MQRHITVGIDVGSYATRVVVCERTKGEQTPRVIGTGQAPTRGVRFGYVTNIEEASRSIKRAISSAEQSSKIRIRKVILAIGGISLSSEICSGTAVITKANSEVNSLDIQKALAEAEENLPVANKRILEVIPLGFKLDGVEIQGRPEGMRGIKLEVKVLFITCLPQHLEDLLTAVAEAGIDVVDIIPSPLASATIALSERQKIAGCALINIGLETTTLIIYENDKCLATKVFKMGGTNITNDLAIGLRVSLDDAEGIKIGSIVNHTFRANKIDEIVDARVAEMFAVVGKYLRTQNRAELLPAGIILTGGGAELASMEKIAKTVLHLPARVGATENTTLRDLSWYTALGVCMIDRALLHHEPKTGIKKVVEDIGAFFKSLGKQLMP